MLERAGYDVQWAPTGKEGLIAAWRDLPEAIVMEMELPDLSGQELVRKLRDNPRTQRTLLVALTELSTPEVAKACMEAGLDEFIIKQTDAIDMLLRFLASRKAGRNAHPDSTAPIRPGRLMAVLAAKGGVGASSLALNLTSHLAQIRTGRPILVADLVLPMGSLAQITAADPHEPVDVVSLTQTDAGALTPEMLRGSLPTPKGWGFHLLPGSENPKQAASLREEGLAPLLQSLRSSFHIVTVDLGNTFSRLSLLVLSQADVILLVFTPEPVAATHVRRTMDYLEGEGIPAQRVFLLANRPYGVESLSGDSLEKALGMPIDAGLPNLGSNMALCNNLHAPLHLRFPEETSTHSLRHIAEKLLQRMDPEGIENPRHGGGLP